MMEVKWAHRVFTVFIILMIRHSNAADVRLPPSIKRQAELLVYYQDRGAKVELTCDAGGQPTPSYEWKKDGKEWTYETGTVLPTANSGNRTITEFSPMFEGKYQCYADNKHGKTMSRPVRLITAYIGNFQQDGPLQRHADEGDSVTLMCNQPKSEPPAAIRWVTVESREDNAASTEVDLSKRVQLDDEGNLVFSHVVPTDESNQWFYRCYAQNTKAGYQAFGSDVQLTVNPATEQIENPPEILTYTGSSSQGGLVVALKRQSLSLRCLYAGYPTPDVTWSRTDRKPLDKRRTEPRQWGTVLHIDDIKDYDQATYKCEGTVNGVGRAHKNLRVRVESVPWFKEGRQPVDQNMTTGDDAVFHCDTEAMPPANVTWYKNTVPITEETMEAEPRLGIESGGKVLRVRKVCKDCKPPGSDLSVYACSATNKHGSAFASGYLNVILRTELVERPRNYTLSRNISLDDDITFTCKGSSDDSTPLSIDWYHDGLRLKNIPGEIHIVAEPDSSTLNINTDDMELVLNEYLGNYSCIINNTYSHVEVSAYLQQAPGYEPNRDKKAGIWWWWIVLLIGILLFVIITGLCCYMCYRWRADQGDEYDVDEKERMNGYDPDNELVRTGYHEYNRPPGQAMKGSRASLSSTMKLDDGDDEGSVGGFNDLEYNTLQFNYQYSMDSKA